MISWKTATIDGLDRVGLDPEGALYKIYDTWAGTGSAQKKSRKTDDKSDLDAAIKGVRANADDPQAYIFDNYDLPAMVNFMVGMSLVSERDCCHKNYYAYRDTNGSQDWSFLQWGRGSFARPQLGRLRVEPISTTRSTPRMN